MTSGAEGRLRKTRQIIIEAATELFLKHGFLGTNMDEVARNANVSKQTVYSHFGAKAALFLKVIEGMTGSAADTLQQRVSDPVDDRPVEAFLLDFAEQQLAIVMTPHLLQLRRLVIGEAERFPELGKALYARGPQRSIERLAKAVAHYHKMGRIDVADAQAAASFFNWLVMGEPVNRAMFLGDDAIPPPRALRRHAQESVRIFLAAYGVR